MPRWIRDCGPLSEVDLSMRPYLNKEELKASSVSALHTYSAKMFKSFSTETNVIFLRLVIDWAMPWSGIYP